MGASWSAAAFRINAGMESGPVALNDFNPLRSLCTPFQFTSMFGISGWGWVLCQVLSWYPPW